MRPSQRKAIKGIVRYYRYASGKRYSVRFKVEPVDDLPTIVTLHVWTRWDGEKGWGGALMDERAYFWIGPRGKITVLNPTAGKSRDAERAARAAYYADDAD